MLDYLLRNNTVGLNDCMAASWTRQAYSQQFILASSVTQGGAGTGGETGRFLIIIVPRLSRRSVTINALRRFGVTYRLAPRAESYDTRIA